MGDFGVSTWAGFVITKNDHDILEYSQKFTKRKELENQQTVIQAVTGSKTNNVSGLYLSKMYCSQLETQVS